MNFSDIFGETKYSSGDPDEDFLRNCLRSNYEIKERLGEGGFGSVYLIKHKMLDEMRAVKLLKSENDEALKDHYNELKERFINEAKLIYSFKNPDKLGLIKIHDVNKHDGRPYYIMEYIQGESLGSKIKKNKKLSIDESISIIIEVLKTLEYVHSNKIVHRDINPKNILINTDGKPIVIDFGIAKDQKQQMTKAKMIGGSEYFASPEQWRDFKTADQRSDIFSTGMTLYYMITGSFYKAKDTGDSNLAEIIDKATAKEPANRYGTAKEFRNQLEELKKKLDANKMANALDNIGKQKTVEQTLSPFLSVPKKEEPKQNPTVQLDQKQEKSKQEEVKIVVPVKQEIEVIPQKSIYERIKESGEIEKFVKEHNGNWNHNNWIYFSNSIYKKIGKISDAELGELLEKEKKNYKEREEQKNRYTRKFNIAIGLKWTENLGRMTWDEAMDKAKAIGMRLPTKEELKALWDSCEKWARDGHFYWSSSVVNNTYYAWFVAFGYGYMYDGNKTHTFYVRCVCPTDCDLFSRCLSPAD